MARLYHAGAEIDAGASTAAQNTGPDGIKAGTGTLTRDTVVFRSGAASWKFDTGAGAVVSCTAPAPTFVDGTTYYARVYVRSSAAPVAAGATFVRLGTTANDVQCNIQATTGKVLLVVSGAAQGSASATSVCDGTWHRLELKAVAAATGNWSSAELLLDGLSIATFSGTQVRGGNGFSFGVISGTPASFVANVDDVALNDSSGASNNNYPGAGAVALLAPTADSAVGAGWTTSNASATGLFANVNITPPAGIADTTASNLHQIRNATANANVNYDATMTTYTAAGVGALDTVNAVYEIVATGAPVTTSAKTGTFGIVSNPTVANVVLNATGTVDAFWSGATAGTYGAGWKWSTGAVQQAPAVTKGTAPVARVTQVTSSTRIAMVCFMGIYVDSTPVSALPFQGSEGEEHSDPRSLQIMDQVSVSRGSFF